MASTGVVIASSIATGVFALLGVVVSTAVAGRRERKQFRIDSAVELAEAETHIWREDWTELSANLQRQETRLAVAGVPTDLVEALHNVSVVCWRDNHNSLERDGHGGIAMDLIEARRNTNQAIVAQLLRRGTRKGREDSCRAAIAQVSSAINDPSRADLRNWTKAEPV